MLAMMCTSSPHPADGFAAQQHAALRIATSRTKPSGAS